MFRSFDRDGNGIISVVEFKHVLTNLGINPRTNLEVIRDEYDEMFRDMARRVRRVRRDNVVNYEEFFTRMW